jgi:hypothetical protein
MLPDFDRADRIGEFWSYPQSRDFAELLIDCEARRLAFLHMARREREILEHAVHTIGEQAAKANELVDEAKAAGGGDHPVTVHAKMLRLELLKVKADLERELEDFSLDCTKCGLHVRWDSGLGVAPGHWGHREPAPHDEPAG